MGQSLLPRAKLSQHWSLIHYQMTFEYILGGVWKNLLSALVRIMFYNRFVLFILLLHATPCYSIVSAHVVVIHLITRVSSYSDQSAVHWGNKINMRLDVSLFGLFVKYNPR